MVIQTNRLIHIEIIQRLQVFLCCRFPEGHRQTLPFCEYSLCRHVQGQPYRLINVQSFVWFDFAKHLKSVEVTLSLCTMTERSVYFKLCLRFGCFWCTQFDNLSSRRTVNELLHPIILLSSSEGKATKYSMGIHFTLNITNSCKIQELSCYNFCFLVEISI